MEGIFRIGGAILFGAVLVGGALFFDTENQERPLDTLTVASKPTLRGYVPTKDSDGDGIRDWKEELDAIAPQPFTAFASSSEPYTPPTTLTDQFAIEMFEDFVRTRRENGTLDSPTVDDFVSIQLKNLKVASPEPLYRSIDLTFFDDASKEALRMYGNNVGNIINEYSLENEHELMILERAVRTNNPETLKEIAPIKDAYEKMLEALLALPTPNILRNEHGALVNAISAIYTDLEAMEYALIDPIRMLLRLETYQTDGQALYDALKQIHTQLSGRSIFYSKDEGGAFFSLFEL